MTRILFTLAMTLTCVQQAQALVLYLDVNNNPDERHAYVKQMEKQHSKDEFVAIPQIKDDSAFAMKSLARKRDKVWVSYVKEGCFAADTCEAKPVEGKCQEIQASLHGIEKEIEHVPKTRLTVEALDAGLKKLVVPKGANITLAISGHFSGGQFTGNLGSITVHDLEQVFSRYPQIRDSIDRLHLLGCYTNTFSQIESMWRKAFPKASILAGFYRQSPLGDDPKNLKFIRALVVADERFDKAKTEKDFSVLVKGFSKIDIPSALTIGDFYQTTDGPLIRISEAKARGSECSKKLSIDERDAFIRVMRGKDPIPTNTSRSILRTYYSDLRNNLMCLDEPEFRRAQPEAPHPDQVIRLIFYKNVVSNFQRMHRADIMNMNSMLQSLGLDASLSIHHVDLTDRKAMEEWKYTVQNKLIAMNTPAAKRAEKVLDSFARIIVALDPYCIPVDWLEPSGFQQSVCYTVPGECS